MKNIAKIPFIEIDSIPQAVKDFLEHNLDGFEGETFSYPNFEQKIKEKGERYKVETRKVLHKVITEQMQVLPLAEKQKNNLDLLVKPNSFTITTGHQLNLGTGPVFFIYKILQTIKTANELSSKFPNQHFVPVFWMASEDHDFLEINHFNTEHDYFEISGNSGGAVGRIQVEEVDFLQKFEANFKDHPWGKDLITIMKEAYVVGRSLSDCTRILVHQIFSAYGLLILDGDDSLLKSTMKAIFKDELQNSSLKKHSEKDVNNLKSRYGKVQVNPRDINLFYLSETRNRIDRSSTGFETDGNLKKFTTDEVFSDVSNHPEHFSPNALMRPIYQEKILPNIAYIGGNAEIMYWLELKTCFNVLEIPFPILIPRTSMLFIKEKTMRKVSKAGIAIQDVLKDFPSLSAKKILENSEILELLDEKEKSLRSQFQEIRALASQTEKTFENLVNAEEKRQLKSFARMRKRLLKAERLKKRELMEFLENLYHEIHPSKAWQERILNFSVFYSEYGSEWLETCFEEIDIEKSQLIMVEI